VNIPSQLIINSNCLVFSASPVEVHKLFLREDHTVTKTVLNTHCSLVRKGFQGLEKNKLKVKLELHQMGPQVLQKWLPHLSLHQKHKLVQSPFHLLVKTREPWKQFSPSIKSVNLQSQLTSYIFVCFYW